MLSLPNAAAADKLRSNMSVPLELPQEPSAPGAFSLEGGNLYEGCPFAIEEYLGLAATAILAGDAGACRVLGLLHGVPTGTAPREALHMIAVDTGRSLSDGWPAIFRKITEATVIPA